MIRRGFTLIELLVVITIIAILAGLILVGANILRRQSKQQQTVVILQMAHQALHIAAADRGGRVAAAEHPLAGSAPPRHSFVRAATPHATIPSSGTAYRGVDPSRLTSGGARLLLGDDRYADATVPMLYGARRAELGVLGPGYAAVTAYRLLPLGEGPIADPDTAGHLVAPDDAPAVAKVLFDHFLGAGNALSELAKLEAVYAPDDDSGLLDNGRVWTADGLNLIEATPARLDGAEHRYRLRGMALYDAWDNEVFYRVEGDRLVLLSAGADGHLVFDPLLDGFQTEPWAETPAPGDADARKDNVLVGDG